MIVKIFPPEEIVETTIDLPLSKSISNRALIMAALTPGAQLPTDVARCDDTDVMVDALRAVKPGSPEPVEVNVGLAGTAMRFLSGYFAATEGMHVLLDGNDRMRQRPIGVLVDALRALGADITYAGQEGFPPLLIRGHRLAGGTLEMEASVSSQFISAVVMVAPTMQSPLTLTLNGVISSMPYLKMTIEMMRHRGIKAELDDRVVTVEPSHYLTASPDIEPDWSAASYWYEIAAMTAGWITLPGMRKRSLQGDSLIADIFERLGVVTEYTDEGAELSASPEMHSRLDLDLADTPDLAQTLAVTCCMLGVPFRFTGLKSLKIKETDRLEALRTELLKLSFVTEVERDDTLIWQMERMPVEVIQPVATYGDHRMAMAFAPVATFIPGLEITGAEVVSKSYPGFWDDMRRAGYTIEEI